MDFDVEKEITGIAPVLSDQIAGAASESHNEAEFRSRVARFIEDFAEKLRLVIPIREEYTLINGRADAVYNRLVVEYEPPNSLHPRNSYRANQHAIGQVKNYISGLSRRERHRPERLAGVVLDGSYFIFLRLRESAWHVDEPVKVAPSSTQYFLRLLASLSTELALIPENLIRDFGENRRVSRKVVSTLYKALTGTQSPKVKTLFEQWRLQFSEVCDYEKASKLKLETFARSFGITSEGINPFHFFFCLHTYYATFIKLLAVQVAHYYLMPRLGTDLRQAATFESEPLKSYLGKMEAGGIFKELGIGNFLEGDFFGWYLDIWSERSGDPDSLGDEAIYQAMKEVITTLANYSLVTLDVDPDATRDLLKKLYQQLMPRELRHNLGEYYTPDWLAERLLNMLEAGKFKGDPNKRILDPACGSGTFLVIAIRKIREYAYENVLPESQVLEKILSNVVGFDLNPLAVISARTNYLLALGDLLQHSSGEVNIPIYLCDSIMTPQESEDLFGKGVLKFNTAVGPFSVPQSLVKAQYIDTLSNFLEEAVRLNLTRDRFVERLTQELPLNREQDERDIEVVCGLYEKFLNLQRQGVNGIWARIIKNAFAPIFVGEFDYVAGNPPWVNWESLPEIYRRETFQLWQKHNLFPHKGFDAILGKAKDDISILMTYVTIDKYLKKGGKLGFLITQSVFKTAGAGQGFRRFQLGDGKPIQALHVDDMVELQPFEGASNRTSVVILQKGKPTKYPMPSYLYWKKTVKGKSIALDSTLDDVIQMTGRKQFVAEPVDENDPTSPWITGRPKALKAVKKVLGQSDYVAHAGCYTGGANAVYWVEIVAQRPDGFVVVSNITEGAKRKVESVQAALEPDLLYPLLRGRDVKRWKAEPSAYIIMAQDPIKRRGIDEDEMKSSYPKTYQYLNRFEGALRERAAFKRYFTRKDKSGRIVETGPFYSMFDVGDYTFAPYKVVWAGFGVSSMKSAVIGTLDKEPIMTNQAMHPFISLKDITEAHYICACMNSAPFNFTVQSHTQKGGKSFAQSNILQHLRIPKFDSQDEIQLRLAELSERAHEAALSDDQETICKIEEEIDELAAQIWKLSMEELKEIKICLEELK